MQDHISQPVRQSHDRLLGNYRILRLLGQGSFADVYLGEHIHLHTQAAIKVLQVRLVENNIQSFLNEARTIAHLVHPYIVRVLDFGVEANTPFLVMDYAPQGTFRQRFLQGKPLPPTSLFPYIKQAASALQYAHDKKLIHRDVKPENMLLGPNEETLLSDFGFALIQTSVTRPSLETAGTASYMAPEQFQGRPQPASDQYSLGVIAYEWLAGTCPFQGAFMELASQHMTVQPPSLIQRVPGLSAQVAQVVMTALAKEPDQRFPSVRDFARALEHACLTTNNNSTSGLPIVPPPFLATTPSLNTNHASPANTEASLSWNNQNPQPFLNSEYQPPNEAQTHFQPSLHSPAFQPNPNSFPPTSTIGPHSPEQTLYYSSQTFQQEQTLRPLSPSPVVFHREQTPPLPPLSAFTPFSQSEPNAVEQSISNLRPNSSWQTPQPPIANTGPTVSNMQQATERFSQAGLPPLQPQRVDQDRSEFTNASKYPPLKSPGQSFSSAVYRSEPALPELPPLPQQPFLAPEFTRQNSPASMAIQAPPQPPYASIRTHSQSRNFPTINADSLPRPDLTTSNQQPSPPSNSNYLSPPESSPLVRAEDFRKVPKSSTSGSLRFFIIVMVTLIIGSTAVLVTLANSQHNGLKGPVPNQQHPTPHANATVTTENQNTTQTPTAEQNPYGNHNGILVLNNPLSQQDQQMQWDESPNKCSFSTDGYHVMASSQSQGFTVCDATASDYTNFVYQVQMTFTKANSAVGSGGLVFRGNNTNKQFYFFEIFTTGNYALYRCPGTNGAACPLLSGGPIASFQAILNHSNTIALLANGNTFSIYVNNQLAVDAIVDTVANSTYSHGRIGMMARQNTATAVTDVLFNNIKIWKV